MADLQKVQQVVQSLATTSGARGLNARANGDMIELHGTVHSLAEKQNVMRAVTEAAGDTGIVNMLEVDRSQPNQLGRGGPAIGVTSASEHVSGRTHKVAKGETLSHIAQRYYGKANDYNRIFEANRDQLKDPDKIREGMELKIPG